ncbi:MAG: hypoxanthine phosphoribosyltransferase [Schwartzia sp.]|nr:hypoxanthine phosphoribosyltransferase [Schwartzia sp. (in: firmicutes)]
MITDDLRSVLFTEEQIAKRVAELGAELTRDYEGKNPLVVGILKGASVFTIDIVRQIGTPLQIDFMVVSSYGSGTKTSGTVKIRKDLDTDVKDRHVIICEDIIDSGVTMSNLFALLKTRKPASLKLCALLSKSARREVEVNIDYCGWEVPDEFLVGYGLDYAEYYRNLPCIGVLKPEIYS